MTGIDPLYVAARRVLLDALEALANHRGALVLVGAQAVYLQAGDAELDAGVAPFTTDADLGVNPPALQEDPRIVQAMTSAGFVLKVKGAGGVEPGSWLARTSVRGLTVTVPVDLLVPEVLAPGHGKRDARLPEHGKNATRWTPGLEPCVVDNYPMTIGSLEPSEDGREFALAVAGPAALLVAKAHKLSERLNDETRGRAHRVRPKDAGDVVRLMRGRAGADEIGSRLAMLANHGMCGPTVQHGVDQIGRLFGGRRSRGVDLAVEALTGALPEEFIRELVPAYVEAMLGSYRAGVRRSLDLASSRDATFGGGGS